MDLKSISLFFVLLFVLSIILNVSSEDDQESGKIWAFLVASSGEYTNYRHQADILRAYKMLIRNGIDHDNIIVMMKDDISENGRNPTPGVILNTPNGLNVYPGIKIDYSGKEVNIDNFKNVLLANGSGGIDNNYRRVIVSGPNDVIFINLVDHGTPAAVTFDGTDLDAFFLLNIVNEMHAAQRYKKMIIYVEACYSGSLFDGILPTDKNILAITAANETESSYSIHYDASRLAYLGDLFSVLWMGDCEEHINSLGERTIEQQYLRVKNETTLSEVKMYGDLSLRHTKLKEFLGDRSTDRIKTAGKGLGGVPTFSSSQVISSADVKYNLLQHKFEKTKSPSIKYNIETQLKELIEGRNEVDKVFDEIVKQLSGNNRTLINELNYSYYPMTMALKECYFEKVYPMFSQHCYNPQKHTYVVRHLKKLVNMCSVPWISTDEILKEIHETCQFHVESRTLSFMEVF